MVFDWLQFLDRNNIEYETRGPNIARDNVAIRCPFCADDPSQHLAIALNGAGYVCRRNRDHRGRSPVRLIQALIRCSFEQAHNIAQGSTFLPDDFAAQVSALLGDGEEPADLPPLKLPPEFYSFNQRKHSSLPYINYLRNRGFDKPDIMRLYDRWKITYCTKGAFKGRIIFPVYFEGRLVTWTGRTIGQRSPVRYKTLSVEPDERWPELPQALGPITNYLLWWDRILDWDADVIILCEGPFDALKLMTLGWDKGIVATCFTTSQPGETQIELLHELLPRFKRKFLLLDRGTEATALKLGADLLTLGIEPAMLPDHLKDPGEMRSIHRFSQGHLEFA